MIFAVGLTYALIAALASLLFLHHALVKENERLFLMSLLFVLVSWSGIEWALWLLGQNLFKLVLKPIIPLASFFIVWTLTIIYLAEKKFRRRDWVLFLAVIAVISAIASKCMDCL